MVTGSFGSASPFTSDFNPFSPNVQGAIGMIYEPLMFFNTAKSGDIQSWLATVLQPGHGGTSITFSLRSRREVERRPALHRRRRRLHLQPNDVSNSALNNLRPAADRAVANGPYQRSHPRASANPPTPTCTIMAGKTYDPAAAHLEDGRRTRRPSPTTQPRRHRRVHGRQGQLAGARPHREPALLPGRPAQGEDVRFLTFTGNTHGRQAIESGEIDWGGGFIPNIQSNYLKKDSKYKVEDIPLSVTYLLTDDKDRARPPNKAVRQAISDAVDRDFISTLGLQRLAPADRSMSLLTRRTSTRCSTPRSPREAFGSPNTAEAKQLLNSAGYTRRLRRLHARPVG